MVKSFWVFCVLAMWVVANGAHHSPSPPPTVDCLDVLMGMSDCIDYVSNGSTVAKPDKTCCSGLATVLKEAPICLCDALSPNNSLGIQVNMTRALTLPKTCGLSAPPANNCAGAGVPPSPAPAPTPVPSPPPMSPPPATPPLPSTPPPSSPITPAVPPSSPITPAVPPTSGEVPAPAPSTTSGALALPVSFSALLLSIAVASATYFF
ncbi:non-specific lipid transfer protein GPI-anchored 31-like isoform X2 [Tasmannia lanceolata]|uniref:non-specific lipid transfer protein GPI-anchored 31-like isoform X2 n=1 Tax=Tasmannia lanceolata TaxID=3420 RepID=UPI004063E7ED